MRSCQEVWGRKVKDARLESSSISSIASTSGVTSMPMVDTEVA
jgi:molecular chaperone DnaK (HSP70)